MSHFSAQSEGSRDFYDFFEHNFLSNVFKKVNTHDFISLGYNFYNVHAGTTTFFEKYADELTERLDDKCSTYDLLRIL